MCDPKFGSKKISAEVREFTRLNPPRNGEGDQAQLGGGGPVREATSAEADLSAEASAKAETGMAEMSERYRKGGNLYVPAAE